MKYSIGDKIIFNKKYIIEMNWVGESYYTTIESAGWIEPWLIGKTATIIKKTKMGRYYVDIPNTHGYDEALFSKFTDTAEVLVEA